MNHYRSRRRAVIPLLALMSCLEAVSRNQPKQQSAAPSRIPRSGIIVFDPAGEEIPSELLPGHEFVATTGTSSHFLQPVCGIIAGDYADAPLSGAANSRSEERSQS